MPKRTTVALLFLVSALLFASFYRGMHLIEWQRVSDAESAFRPILHLGCHISSQPIAFHRYCRYIVEFPPESRLTDANAAQLRSLNQLPSENTLDVVIQSPQVTDQSLLHLKAMHPFGRFDALDVMKSSITDAGIDELCRTFPTAIIVTRNTANADPTRKAGEPTGSGFAGSAKEEREIP